MKDENQPGTLVWIGDPSQCEFVDAFRFCRDHAAQIAIRRTPRELVARPAGWVKRIVFTRPDRRPLPRKVHAALADRYGDAQWLVLNAALCDGETRTGEPWPQIPQLRFSRWEEALPGWLQPCGYTPPPRANCGSLLVICDRYEMAEPYLEIAASQGRTTLWKREFNRSWLRNINSVLWDDSLATPTTAQQWRLRLGENRDQPVRHLWLATQPQAAEIRAALAGGVCQVFSKPVAIEALFA